MLPKKLAIAVAFHYVESRLVYLGMISDHFSQLADELSVTIVTNSNDTENLSKITRTLEGKGFEFSFLVPKALGHPFLLTWSHFADFRQKIEDPSYSHFMYLEDDMLITRQNMEYWMGAREALRDTGFYPSFLRVEKKDGADDWYSTDGSESYEFRDLPSVTAPAHAKWLFVNVPNPYQGMYLLDREQMLEHLSGPSSAPEYGLPKGIRERATRGLNFANVKKGYYSRNLLPFCVDEGRLDEACFIHHTPNNYANDPYSGVYGKIKTDLFIYSNGDVSNVSLWLARLVRKVKVSMYQTYRSLSQFLGNN